MTEADNVNSERTAIGVRNVSLGPNTVFALYMSVATHMIYNEAQIALIKGFFVTSCYYSTPVNLPHKIYRKTIVVKSRI